MVIFVVLVAFVAATVGTFQASGIAA